MAPRSSRTIPLAILVAAITLVAATRLFFPSQESLRALLSWWPWRCPLKLLTGFPCPTCGLTRSLVATLSLDWEKGLRIHPAGPLLVIMGFALLLLELARPGTSRMLATKTIAAVRRHPVSAAILLLLYVVWGTRRAWLLGL
jgi:hypothetical protein